MRFNRKAVFVLFSLIILSSLSITCGEDDKGAGPDPEPPVPSVTTNVITAITRTSAQGGGIVVSEGGDSVTACGVCWSTSANPTLSDNCTSDFAHSVNFVSSMDGLTLNTTYHVRAYATNSVGTGYGSNVTFTTLDSAYTVTDIDGNVYRAISIGTQVWMTENLKVTHYRNGDAIPYESQNADWLNLTTGAYCNYDNWFVNGLTYGSLYNWFATNDSRGLAPEGWHVPSESEWSTLRLYLTATYGVTSAEMGGIMKDTGTAHWTAPNTGATNASGFSALPGGVRSTVDNGDFVRLHLYGGFWCSSEDSYDTTQAPCYFLRNLSTALYSVPTGKEYGFSIRCIKD
jgi:uncharacterized protein (TIGR02145 family)